MGQREDSIRNLILKKYPIYKHDKLTMAELQKSSHQSEVEEIYVKLGGQQHELPVKFGPWDISTKKFIIEFDEEMHFNRYRYLTLNSNLYCESNLFDVNKYLDYCLRHENKCLKAAGYGGKWKNDSTERMFIKSDIEKNIETNGSSRWRQRAYYDFLKDVKSKISGIPVIRIAIYDNVRDADIETILANVIN